MNRFEERILDYKLKKSQLENMKVEVKTLSDIRKAIAPFLSRNIRHDEGETTITTSLEGLHISPEDDSLKKSKINTLSAKVSTPDMRKLLLKGLEIIRNRQELQVDKAPSDEYGGFEPAEIVTSADQYMWVDSLIIHCLDAKRRGLEIVWELPEGTYVFNPETEELREESR